MFSDDVQLVNVRCGASNPLSWECICMHVYVIDTVVHDTIDKPVLISIFFRNLEQR